jgi:hypothetical protein
MFAFSATSESCAFGRAGRTYPHSGSGVPSTEGVMSTALVPSSDTEPSTAVERSVIRVRFSLFTSKMTSTWSAANSIRLTLPTCTPAMRTGEPMARPATSGKRVFSE